QHRQRHFRRSGDEDHGGVFAGDDRELGVHATSESGSRHRREVRSTTRSRRYRGDAEHRCGRGVGREAAVGGALIHLLKLSALPYASTASYSPYAPLKSMISWVPSKCQILVATSSIRSSSCVTSSTVPG